MVFYLLITNNGGTGFKKNIKIIAKNGQDIWETIKFKKINYYLHGEDIKFNVNYDDMVYKQYFYNGMSTYAVWFSQYTFCYLGFPKSRFYNI